MPVSPEGDWEYWDNKAVELWRNQGENIATTASKWSALTSALLGVTSAVAFAGGLKTLDELSEPWRVAALSLTTAALGSAVCAIVLLSLAAGGIRTTQLKGPLDGTTVKHLTVERVRSRYTYLRLGRLGAVIAAGLVVAGSVLVLWADEVETRSTNSRYVAVFEDGAVCGELVALDGSLSVGSRQLDGALLSLISVAACPIGDS